MLVTYAEIYIIFISNYAIKGKMAIRTGAEGELYYRLPRRGYLLCGGIGEILTERGLRRPIRAFTNHLEYPPLTASELWRAASDFLVWLRTIIGVGSQYRVGMPAHGSLPHSPLGAVLFPLGRAVAVLIRIPRHFCRLVSAPPPYPTLGNRFEWRG